MPEKPTQLHPRKGAATPAKAAKKDAKKPDARTFAVFEDAKKIAERLIAKGVEGTAVLKNARILYLSTSRDKVGRDGAANATKFAEWAKTLKDFDFVLQFSLPCWRRYTEVQREALVYHELLHCRLDSKNRAVIVPHDLEEFAAVVKLYGLWDPRIREMHAQMVLWEVEPDGVAGAGAFRRSAARRS